MATIEGSAHIWPALDLGGRELPAQITYERGIWGKMHGASTDFRWIATTPALVAPQKHLHREWSLGADDAPVQATLWRALGETFYAIGIYPSRAHDANGRSGFLERQVLEWKRPPDIPAALGALLLLPAVARLDGREWWNQRTDVRWSESDHVLDLPAAAPVAVSPAEIEAAVADGVRALAGVTTEDALADLYAALLSGSRGVRLKGLDAPLPPTAVAVLLLPLPRTIADTISVAGWLPSTWLSDSGAEEVRRNWDLVLGGSTPLVSYDVTPTTDQLRKGREMARSLLARRPVSASPMRQAESAPRPVQLALWGPTAAGKTALLAKLYLEARGDAEWDVLPTQQSLEFIETMRNRMHWDNVFPAATGVGAPEGIEYLFKHRKTGVVSSLQLEDRAGRESEELHDETLGGQVSLKKRLGSADGIVLLFDSAADEARFDNRLSRALELLHVASGRAGQKDDRPIAVCVSKADLLIETAADFRQAVEHPDRFVRERMPGIIGTLDRFCENYQLFPVSSAGVRLRQGIIEPAVFFDERLEARLCPGGRPFNLMAPFSWLLKKLVAV